VEIVWRVNVRHRMSRERSKVPWQRQEGEMPKPQRGKAIRGAGLMCVTVTFAGACAPKVPQQTSLMRVADSRIASDHLRATENVLAITIPGDIETTADEIMARAEEPVVRRQALRWKLEAIPTYYQVLFQGNSLAAAMDTVVLAAQIEDYLATGPGRDRFGHMQPVALEGARRMRTAIGAQMKVMAERPEAFERMMQRLETWARQHPIGGPSLSSRPSVVPFLTKLAGPDEANVFGVVGDIGGSIADLATRLDIYSAYVPKATRWQADLLVGDLATQEEARLAMSALASLEKVTHRVDALASQESIDEATSFAVTAFRAERDHTIDEIDQMKAEVLAYLKGERLLVMSAVDASVNAALADVDRQRTMIVKHVEDVRTQTLADLELLRRQSFIDLDALTNRVILKVTLVMAVMLVLAALFAALVLRLRTTSLT
jgi:hypothetical protein